MAERKSLSVASWAMISVSIVIVPLFFILVWQLYQIDPKAACLIFKSEGVPPGNHCFQLFTQSYELRGWVVIGALATLAAFLLVLLVYLAKTVISVVGPGGMGMSIGQNEHGNTEVKVGEAASPKGNDNVQQSH